MSDPRFWLLGASVSQDTAADNRINEVRVAATFDVLGLVDEEAGGVVGYLSVEVADSICNLLNYGVDEQ